jgi:preprotein translocase subunit SecD
VIKETGLLEFIQILTNEFIPNGTIVETDYLTSGVPGPETDDDTTQLTPSPESSPSPEPTDAIAASDQATPTPTEGSTEPTVSPTPMTAVYHTVMTGTILKNAYVGREPTTGEFIVSFELTDEGSDIFAEYTTNHVGERLGIVLDKRLIAAPMISTPITEGTGYIEGEFTAEAANNLAVTLRYGSLPVALVTVETKSVGPTLGQDSLRKSTIAGLVGLLVVMVFMAFYYRLPGLLADLALLVYAVITFALFKLIPVTLTLPGIAGFVLSLGVAVDANVLIFERMKEELRSGLRLDQAIDLGFSRAWPSIRDSNLSTLITCAILYWFGNTFGASIVKGFSLTLSLGVLVSLFTAITVTRTFLHIVLDNLKIADHPRWFGI